MKVRPDVSHVVKGGRAAIALGAVAVMISLGGCTSGPKSEEASADPCVASSAYVSSLANASDLGGYSYGDVTTFAGGQSLYESSWSVQLLEEAGVPVPSTMAKALETQFRDQLSSEPSAEVDGLPGLQATLLAVQGLLALGAATEPPQAWLRAAEAEDGRVAYGAQAGPSVAAASTYARIARLTGADIPRIIVDDAVSALQTPAVSAQYLYETGIPALSILSDAGNLSSDQVELVHDWSSAITSAPPSPQGLTALDRLQTFSRSLNGPTVNVPQAYVTPLRPPSGSGLAVAGGSPVDAQVTLAGTRLGLVADPSVAAAEQLELASPRGWSGRRSAPTLRSNYMAVAVLRACDQAPKPIGPWARNWFEQNRDRQWTAEELYEFSVLVEASDVQLSPAERGQMDQRAAEVQEAARASRNPIELTLALLSERPGAVSESDVALVDSPASTRQASLIWRLGKMTSNDHLQNRGSNYIETVKTDGAFTSSVDATQVDLLSSAQAASMGADIGDDVLAKFRRDDLWVLGQSDKEEQPTNLLGIYAAVGFSKAENGDHPIGVVG